MDKKSIDSVYKFNSKTELATKLNISRQTLYKRLKDNNIKNANQLTQSEFNALKSVKNSTVKDRVIDSKVYNRSNTENRELVKALQSQIDSQNETIKSLNEQLLNSQKLQLLNAQEKKQLLEQLNQLKSLEQPKQGFWSRLFGVKSE